MEVRRVLAGSASHDGLHRPTNAIRRRDRLDVVRVRVSAREAGSAGMGAPPPVASEPSRLVGRAARREGPRAERDLTKLARLRCGEARLGVAPGQPRSRRNDATDASELGEHRGGGFAGRGAALVLRQRLTRHEEQAEGERNRQAQHGQQASPLARGGALRSAHGHEPTGASYAGTSRTRPQRLPGGRSSLRRRCPSPCPRRSSRPGPARRRPWRSGCGCSSCRPP